MHEVAKHIKSSSRQLVIVIPVMDTAGVKLKLVVFSHHALLDLVHVHWLVVDVDEAHAPLERQSGVCAACDAWG